MITLAVAFVNGMTDAPNAIVSCVSTKTISLKKAVVLAAVSDFAGSLTLGLINRKVADTIIEIVVFDSDSDTTLIALAAAMSSVVLWAVLAWFFGIPTSESHALISALAGAGFSLNGDLLNLNIIAWKKVVYGLFVSVVFGFVAGYVASKSTDVMFRRIKSEKIFEKSQIISSAFMSFMHGAQDSQKFTAIIMLIFFGSGNLNGIKPSVLLSVLSPVFISLGTATGGERIIKSIGTDMIKMEKNQGFSSDIAGSICLLLSTLSGMPVSTTHTKTAAILGVGVANNVRSVSWNVVSEIFIAWLVTFPACGFIGWILTKLFCFMS